MPAAASQSHRASPTARPHAEHAEQQSREWKSRAERVHVAESSPPAGPWKPRRVAPTPPPLQKPQLHPGRGGARRGGAPRPRSRPKLPRLSRKRRRPCGFRGPGASAAGASGSARERLRKTTMGQRCCLSLAALEFSVVTMTMMMLMIDIIVRAGGDFDDDGRMRECGL